VVVRQLVITITIIIIIFIIIDIVIIIVIIALIVSWSSSISTSPPSFNIDRIVIIITLVTIIDIAAASMFIAGTGGASALVIVAASKLGVQLSRATPSMTQLGTAMSLLYCRRHDCRRRRLYGAMTVMQIVEQTND